MDPEAGAVGPPLPDLEVPRLGHAATLLPDGRILVTGGRIVAVGAALASDDDPRSPSKNHYILAARAALASPNANIDEVLISVEIDRPPQ